MQLRGVDAIMVHMARVITVFLFTLAVIFVPLKSQAAAARLLVIYPQSSPAYDQIFKEIIDGIDSYPAAIHFVLPVLPTTSAQELSSYVSANGINAIIALGKQTYDLASALKEQLPVIHGGLMINPDGHIGISLAGAPQQFFARLSEIAPGVRRVFTVYNEENSGWIIHLAQQVAKSRGIELKAYPANDIREAVQKFRTIVDQARDSSDAIWLLLDNILPDKTIMPMALEAAWQRKVVLFSSNPSHTRRGALFALFPDHQQMGHSLAELAVAKSAERPRQPEVLPLSNLKISLNRRTAAHLGLSYDKPVADEVDVVFPTK